MRFFNIFLKEQRANSMNTGRHRSFGKDSGRAQGKRDIGVCPLISKIFKMRRS